MDTEKCSECDNELVSGEKGRCVYCELNHVKVNAGTAAMSKNTNCVVCDVIVVRDIEVDGKVVREKGSLYCVLCKRWYHNACIENPLDDKHCSFLNNAPKNIKWFCDSHEKWIEYAYNNNKQCGCKKKVKHSVAEDSFQEAKNSGISPKNRTVKHKTRVSTKNISQKISKPNITKKEVNCPDESAKEDVHESGKGDIGSGHNDISNELIEEKNIATDNTSFEVDDPEFQPGESDIDSDHSDQDDQSEEDGKDEKRKYIPCDKCPKYFYKESCLEAHMRWHKGDKRPYKCPICKRGFSKRLKAKRHAAVHTNEPQVMCDICGKGFYAEQNLKYHMKVHSSERPYKCELCEKAFKHQKNLKVHMFVHTKEKRHFCSICGFGTATKDRLTLHMKTVHKHKTGHNLTSDPVGTHDTGRDNIHKQKIQSVQKSKPASESNASDSNSSDSVPPTQHNQQSPPFLVNTGGNDKTMAAVYPSSHYAGPPPTGVGSWGFIAGPELYRGSTSHANPSSFNYYHVSDV